MLSLRVDKWSQHQSLFFPIDFLRLENLNSLPIFQFIHSSDPARYLQTRNLYSWCVTSVYCTWSSFPCEGCWSTKFVVIPPPNNSTDFAIRIYQIVPVQTLLQNWHPPLVCLSNSLYLTIYSTIYLFMLRLEGLSAIFCLIKYSVW